MPVLDAKALEIDPKGAAFLLSVLREKHTSKTLPRDIPGLGRIRFRIINQFRLSERPKNLQQRTA